MRINRKKALPDDVLINNLHIAAKVYQQYANKDVLVIYAVSKKGPFRAYQFYAGEENFQHLAGVKSPKGAKWFFNKCLDDKDVLKRNDIVPVENMQTT